MDWSYFNSDESGTFGTVVPLSLLLFWKYHRFELTEAEIGHHNCT